MRAVSDTSPISNLASIGRLALLHEQFSEIWIPGAVGRELDAHPDPQCVMEIQQALRAGRIRASAVASSPLLRVLAQHLDRGEAESIAMAVELKADIVLIDEQEGRQYAAEAGLKVTGVLGVLLRAKALGQIAAVRPEIEALRLKAHFFVAPALEARVLAAAREK